MDTLKIILKSIVLSTTIFWIIIISKDFETDMLYLIPLSWIPISLCCLITICITVLPFFSFKPDKYTNKAVFKRYFPFYSIVCFGLCFYASYNSKFDIDLMSFLASAFFTTTYTWVLFAKKPNEQNHLED
ncbi:hypothetical protein [uncultured Algibacter sp.]|uniref:hypothetical protein n=1 Tax=uncultured Algibacter sp. TaxID=298659 RepID=UPI003217649B